MKHTSSLWPVIFMLAAATPAVAAEPGAAAATLSVCQADDRFRGFDFWLGEWDVFANDDEQEFQGTNSVTRHHNGCLVVENWTSARGTTGSSMNYFDPVAGHWRQVWVADAYSIDYTGGPDESGAMVLVGSIHYFEPGSRHAFRGTWTPLEDGRVRQLFEQQDADSGQWQVWFDGIYVRK